MPLRTLLRIFTMRYGEDAIQKLSETKGMRRAAQLTAFLYHKGRQVGEESIEKIKESQTIDKLKSDYNDTGDRVQSFKTTLSRELKDGLNEFKEELKRQKK